MKGAICQEWQQRRQSARSSQQQGIIVLLIQPGKPARNVYIERCNRTARHEWLDEHLFTSIEHAQEAGTE